MIYIQLVQKKFNQKLKIIIKDWKYTLSLLKYLVFLGEYFLNY
jgi:hypothetical protein